MSDEINGRYYAIACDCWSLDDYICMYGYWNEWVTI